MTNSAISASCIRHELAAVIVDMAIGALRKRDRRLEIALVVAITASHAAVLSEKRISCLRMIEALQLGHLGPLRCVVARLARAFESALMRIGMAAGASGKRKPGVLDVRFGIGDRRFQISHRSVAFRAGYGGMRSRQRELRLGVVEAGRRLPCICRVALSAVRADLSAVLILMAACACAGESQVSVIEVLYLNSGPARRQDFLSVVALFTA